MQGTLVEGVDDQPRKVRGRRQYYGVAFIVTEQCVLQSPTDAQDALLVHEWCAYEASSDQAMIFRLG